MGKNFHRLHIIVAVFLLGATVMPLPTEQPHFPGTETADEDHPVTATVVTTVTTTIDYDLADLDERNTGTKDTVDLTDLGQGDGTILDAGSLGAANTTYVVIGSSSNTSNTNTGAAQTSINKEEGSGHHGSPLESGTEPTVNSRESPAESSLESQGEISAENNHSVSSSADNNDHNQKDVSAKRVNQNAIDQDTSVTQESAETPAKDLVDKSSANPGVGSAEDSIEQNGPVSVERSSGQITGKDKSSADIHSKTQSTQTEKAKGNQDSSLADTSVETREDVSTEMIDSASMGEVSQGQIEGSKIEGQRHTLLESSLENDAQNEFSSERSMTSSVSKSGNDKGNSFLQNCFGQTSPPSCFSMECKVCEIIRQVGQACQVYYPNSCSRSPSDHSSKADSGSNHQSEESNDKESDEEFGMSNSFTSSSDSNENADLDAVMQATCPNFCGFNLSGHNEVYGEKSTPGSAERSQDGGNAETESEQEGDENERGNSQYHSSWEDRYSRQGSGDGSSRRENGDGGKTVDTAASNRETGGATAFEEGSRTSSERLNSILDKGSTSDEFENEADNDSDTEN